MRFRERGVAVRADARTWTALVALGLAVCSQRGYAGSISSSLVDQFGALNQTTPSTSNLYADTAYKVFTRGLMVPGTGGGATPAASHVANMPPVSGGLTLARSTSSAQVLGAKPSGAQSLGGFSIVIVPDTTLAANAPALAAFNRAAQTWASRISDPITVTVNASLASLGSGIIGSTSSFILQGGYDLLRDQMVADAAAQPAGNNNAIVTHLPTSAQFTATLPAGQSLDGNVLVSKANAKALGFTGLDSAFGASDGSITFSSNFAFDYDSSDGVTPGTEDFQTVATHEIGHLLGFFSSVDDLDAGGATISPTTQDLFRFKNLAGSKPTNASEFTTMARSLQPGVDEVTSDTTNEYRMSTGLTQGDGRQASHWKADELTGQYIGIMDPTLASGVTEAVTDADFRALDLIGYDVLVPEPSSLGVVVAGAMAVLARRRRALVK